MLIEENEKQQMNKNEVEEDTEHDKTIEEDPNNLDENQERPLET